MSKLPKSLRRDAELVVDVCMSVGQEDVVTIITDDDHSDEAAALAEVCVERGAFPVIASNEHQVRRGIADTRFPMAPPRNLHNAMTNSDEIIIITNLEWANRFAHVSAVKESCAANAKIAELEKKPPAEGNLPVLMLKSLLKVQAMENRVRLERLALAEVTLEVAFAVLHACGANNETHILRRIKRGQHLPEASA